MTTGTPHRNSGEPKYALGKRRQIEDELRSLIRDGTWKPGTRIPTRVELEKRFQASSATVQWALDELVKAGFVESRARHGTFVVELLPHLYRYGLVFPYQPDHSEWTGLSSCLAREAAQVTKGIPQRFAIYTDVRQDVSTPDHQRLIHDLSTGQLAGVLFTVTPWQITFSPSTVFTHQFPWAFIGEADQANGGSNIVLDPQLMERAIEHLAAAGVKRLAVISNPVDGRAHDRYAPIIAKAGMATRRGWWFGLPASRNVSEVASQIALSLFDAPSAVRPDGLIVGDDNHLQQVAAGLRKAGLTDADLPVIVAHANLPDPVPPPIPCRRLGFDARRILRQALRLLDRVRDGGDPSSTVIQVQFEDEIPRPLLV